MIATTCGCGMSFGSTCRFFIGTGGFAPAAGACANANEEIRTQPTVKNEAYGKHGVSYEVSALYTEGQGRAVQFTSTLPIMFDGRTDEEQHKDYCLR